MTEVDRLGASMVAAKCAARRATRCRRSVSDAAVTGRSAVFCSYTRFSSLELYRIACVVASARPIACLFELNQFSAHLSASNRAVGSRTGLSERRCGRDSENGSYDE